LCVAVATIHLVKRKFSWPTFTKIRARGCVNGIGDWRTGRDSARSTHHW